MQRLKFFIHNIILHPIAGLFWVIGFNSIGDYIHGLLKVE